VISSEWMKNLHDMSFGMKNSPAERIDITYIAALNIQLIIK
jgi:hypothetical protein